MVYMMARAAAAGGLGVATGLSSSRPSLTVPSVASHSYRPFASPLLVASSRLQSLAPAALYSSSALPTPLNSAGVRSGFLQLGLSVLHGSPPVRQQRVCGAARGMAAGSGSDLVSSIKKTISEEPVVVYSKTYCPYCMRVKKLLGSLGYDFEVVELDAGGPPGLQDALERVSGQYTVPNVFIGGKHIGGCDDTVALHSRGQLEPKIQAAGAKRK